MFFEQTPVIPAVEISSLQVDSFFDHNSFYSLTGVHLIEEGVRHLITTGMASNSGWAGNSEFLPILKDMGFNEKRIETCLMVLSSTIDGCQVSLQTAVEW